MPVPLTVLIVEDQVADAELMLYQLRTAGYEPSARRVDSAEAYAAALDQLPQVILADYSLPQFDALQALKLLQARELDTPFIIVTGTIGEEAAVECMKLGATDYLLKDRLARLGPAVDRALKDQAIRQAKRRAEQVQAAAYQITAAAQTAATLTELFETIHTIIGELMLAEDFYIALYDASSDTIRYAYSVDAHDDPIPPDQPVPLGRSLTAYVLRTGRPLLATRENFQRLAAAGEVELVGQDSVVWLGVPLKVDGAAVGAMVVQSYQEDVGYTEADQQVLEFVSAQAALAIDRKRAEEELRQSEERFRILAENSPGAVYLCRNDLRYSSLYLNDTMEAISGYAKEDFLSGRLSITELIHPDDLATIRFQVDQAVARSVPYHLIYRIHHRAGELRWLEEWGTSIRTAEGEVMLEGFISDITERRRAEEALRQAQKMESLGILAGGIAHDFNNLLVAILGQASLALRRLAPEDPARHNVEMSVRAAERAADLTRQLLAYSGRGQFAVRSISLNDMIVQNMHIFLVAIPKSVQFHSRLADALPLIEADPGQMQQVVMNLVINAAEAIGDAAGVLSVATQAVDLPAGDPRLWQPAGDPLPPGQYVMLEVQDDGAGMDAETLSRIFDPFFTTKFTGRGLGLAAVLGIVRGHNGGLQVESQTGRGTTFRLFFPVRAGEPEVAAPPTQPAAASDSAAQLAVLVIDDEEPVRQAVQDILEVEGIRVYSAPDGDAGLALYRQQADDIGVVLLDLSMPGMSGEMTFEALRTIQPDVRIVLTSGYSQTEAARRFSFDQMAGFLQKPYDVETLLREVRRHLVSA